MQNCVKPAHLLPQLCALLVHRRQLSLTLRQLLLRGIQVLHGAERRGRLSRPALHLLPLSSGRHQRGMQLGNLLLHGSRAGSVSAQVRTDEQEPASPSLCPFWHAWARCGRYKVADVALLCKRERYE